MRSKEQALLNFKDLEDSRDEIANKMALFINLVFFSVSPSFQEFLFIFYFIFAIHKGEERDEVVKLEQIATAGSFNCQQNWERTEIVLKKIFGLVRAINIFLSRVASVNVIADEDVEYEHDH